MREKNNWRTPFCQRVSYFVLTQVLKTTSQRLSGAQQESNSGLLGCYSKREGTKGEHGMSQKKGVREEDLGDFEG